MYLCEHMKMPVFGSLNPRDGQKEGAQEQPVFTKHYFREAHWSKLDSCLA